MNSFVKIICSQCKVYYGSDERKGMCSVCYKNYKMKEADQNNLLNPINKNVINNSSNINEIVNALPLGEINKQTADLEEKKIKDELNPVIEKKTQDNKFACFTCNKIVGYNGFKCKCENIFCGRHRHFSDHNCNFDYKNYDKVKLASKNPLGTNNVNDNKMIK